MKIDRSSLLTAFVFGGLAAALVWRAVALGGWAWLLLWPAVAFLIVAIAYGGAGVRAYGKRADGRFSRRAVVLNAPARWFMHFAWVMKNLLAREPAFHLIVPGLYLGRRPNRMVPPDLASLIDLAGELPASRVARDCVGYRSVPTLDRSVMPDDAFVELVRLIAADVRPTFVHCAQGHGRSAQVVAGVLLARGLADGVGDAIARVRACRPGVRLAASQVRQLDRCAARLKEFAHR